GKLDEAEIAYRELLQAHPHNVGVLHLLGAVYHQRGAFAPAAERFREALAVQPGHIDAQRGLPEALLAEAKLLEPETLARGGVAAAPGHAPLHFTLGAILRRQGKPQDAIIAFGKAVQIQPTLVEAQLNLGIPLAETAQPALAEAAYRAALAARPGFAEAWI